MSASAPNSVKRRDMPEALAVAFPACMDSTDWPMFRCSSPSSPSVFLEVADWLRCSSWLRVAGSRPSWRRYSSSRLESLSTSYRRAVRSSEEISLNSSWLARAAVTPSTTLFWPVSASWRICRAAVSTATSNGTAISARPSSINPLNDLGRAHCMAHSSRKAPADVSSPRLAGEALLPGQCSLHDGIEVIELRPPAQHGADLVGAGNQHRRVARPTGFLTDRQWTAGHPFDALQHFSHAISTTIADVQYLGDASLAQVGEGVQVRCGEVLDVYVVADSSAVLRREVGTVDGNVRPLADHGLAGDLDQQGRFRRGLADPAAGIRA